MLTFSSGGNMEYHWVKWSPYKFNLILLFYLFVLSYLFYFFFKDLLIYF